MLLDASYCAWFISGLLLCPLYCIYMLRLCSLTPLEVSNLVFYAPSTIAVISGRMTPQTRSRHALFDYDYRSPKQLKKQLDYPFWPH